MPRYISITPTFNPISTEEYLRVPLLLLNDYREQEEKLENHKDKLSYIKALMGDSDEAKAIWSPYDQMMADVAANPTLNNVRETSKKLRSAFRDVEAKATIAKQAYDTQVKRAQSDPTLLGSIGNFMDYYNNPEYVPNLVSRKEIVSDISNIMGTAFNALPFTNEGVDPTNKSQILYSRGFTDTQLNGFLADAMSAQPQTTVGKSIHDSLASRGFFNLSPAEQASALGDITSAMRTGAIQRSYQKNPNFMSPSEAQSYEFNRLKLKEARENYEKYGTVTGQHKGGWQSTYDKDGNEYRYKYESSGVIMDRYDETTKKWVPAESYTSPEGTEYNLITPGHFGVPKGKSASTQPTEYKAVMSSNPKTGAKTSVQDIMDHPERYITDISQMPKRRQADYTQYLNQAESGSTVYYDKEDGTFITVVPKKASTASQVPQAGASAGVDVDEAL